jgi:hypothetical protein
VSDILCQHLLASIELTQQAWQPNILPLRAIWLAPLFRLIGGGDAVAATVVLATLTDIYTDQDRYATHGSLPK